MSKFVIAIYSQVSGDTHMSEFEATSDMEAAIAAIMEYEQNWHPDDFINCQDLEDVKQLMFDNDHAIEVVEVT